MRAQKYIGVVALLALWVALPARAFIWNEINAGSLPSTAEITHGLGPLTQINGQLNFDNNTQSWGVDMYAIAISDPAHFLATTETGPNNLSDPALYLFNSAGLGVYMNNDNSTTDQQATLPAGNPLGPQAFGIYYLAIAWGFSDALSFGSIFDLAQFVDTPGVYGPTGPGGGSPVTGWDTSSAPVNFDLPAHYTIDLRGAIEAPEPGTLALLAAATFVLMVWRRKSR